MGQVVRVALGAVAGVGCGELAFGWAAALAPGAVRASGRPLCRGVAALAFALAFARAPDALSLLRLCGLVVPLLALSAVDLSCLVIPNACVAACVAIELLALVATSLAGGPALPAALARSLLAAACGLGFPLLAALVMDRILGRESMGGGDLKLLGAAGFVLGPGGLVLALPLACLLGIATSAMRAWRSGSGLEPFPFGPAIALALWSVALLGSGP